MTRFHKPARMQYSGTVETYSEEYDVVICSIFLGTLCFTPSNKFICVCD